MNNITFEKQLPFNTNEYDERLVKIKKIMNLEGIDYLLINDPVDLNYLLGYRSWGFTFMDWQALIISLEKDPVLVTRTLESTNFKFQTYINKIETFSDEEDPIDKTIKVLKNLGISNKTIALPFDSWFMNVNHYRMLENKLPSSVKLVDGSEVVMNCRMIKSNQEISYILQSANITNKVMNQIKDSFMFNPTDNELAHEITSNLIAQGSELPATPPFIGIGKRSTYGHPVWENIQSKKGDVIFLEFSGCVQRYHAPIMRTLSIGKPTDQAKRFEEASFGLINEITEKVELGMKVQNIDTIAKEYLKKINMDKYFHNRIGYSVGIGFTKWMDGISIKKGVNVELQENMVFHIIPFITDFEISVAISETVLLTNEGMKKLTNVPQEIIVLDN